MTKISDVYKAEFVQRADESRKTGRVALTFEVSPEVKDRLEAVARQANMSVSRAAGIILEAQVDKHVKLENSLRKMVRKAFEEEFNRIAEELLFFYARNKDKKGLSN